LTTDQRSLLDTANNESTIRAIVEAIHPCSAVLAELEQRLADLCPNSELVAVRSSASDEDGVQHSFAGQLDSFLYVPPSAIAHKVAAVWRSGFSERIIAYRREHNLSLVPRVSAVLIQRMVTADVAGVAFGADPVTGRRGVAVVSAVYGVGTSLVSGECDADTFHVDRDGNILQRAIADKRISHRAAIDSVEGVRAVAVPDEQARKPALSDDQVRAVANLVRRTGQFFGRPQDIEWAIEKGQLYLLQSRPITSLVQVADPDGAYNLWDNSNIAESYNGITTPLTFSFARRVYEEVYRQFCRILRVPEA
jgi:pyruvate,water dikinase